MRHIRPVTPPTLSDAAQCLVMTIKSVRECLNARILPYEIHSHDTIRGEWRSLNPQEEAEYWYLLQAWKEDRAQWLPLRDEMQDVIHAMLTGKLPKE